MFITDSVVSYEDYAVRVKELGHKIISSVEHGWQSNYYVPYGVAKKHNLKFVFGAEAYWVKDRYEKDRSNHHIIILARNENGRQMINDILAEASITGYYFRPRVDLELLLSLPKDDVFLTSACLAFWNEDNIEEIIVQLHNHFGNNFMLEIQNHATEKQIVLNKRILELSHKHKIEMIVGLDSHYILEKDAGERSFALASKGIHYEDEEGWYMDYPPDDITKKRFMDQNIFSEEQIVKAMDNADIVLEFDDFEFDKEIKLPTLYPDKTQDEKNKIYSQLITKNFKEYMKTVDKADYQRYYDGVKSEVQVYKNTGMVDYPLLDYAIVKRAVEMGGLITDTGRGSAVGFFTNTLCGFSKVDRFVSAIKLYPERFISESRILETKSLPDIDLNVGNVEIFEEAQREILGEDHVYPMIAFGTFKKKSAFKLYAKAKKLDFDIAGVISGQIEKYETALKYAEDDERDEIDIYDYVEEEYHDYISQSETYWGIISDKKKAPSAYLLYQGNIRKEIGLIKCKSETTKKEYITTVIDGAIAEEYKFLKNDILKVDVVLLINNIYNRIGIKHHTVSELLELVKNDKKVWKLYADGFTLGINQCEKEATTKKAMKYKMSNVSELSAFIAGIRPGFKSMYSVFESRQPFSYGIPTFDKLLTTEELPIPFMIFQEQTMQVLNYAGFPMDECYGIIKSIAKKHPEKVRPLKSRFIDGFSKIMIKDDNVSDETAKEMSDKVWKIIEDNANYSFNSSHAYCMALDSLYNAWQKANYPYEFYEVMLQHYSNKGKKDKVSLLKQEMSNAYGIQEGKYKFKSDNRNFVADKENKTIYSSLLAVKGLSQKTADSIYSLSQKKQYVHFYDLYKDMKKVKSLNIAKVNVLIKLDYFSQFGKIGKLLNFVKYAELLIGRSQFSKTDADKFLLPYLIKYSEESEKQYNKFNSDSALYEIWDDLEDTDIKLYEKLKNELEYLGYIQTKVQNMSPEYAFIQEYECKFKNPKLLIYRICNGNIQSVKVKRAQYDENPINKGDIIKIIECKDEGRWFNDGKDKNGKPAWRQDQNDKEPILKKWTLVR